MEDRQLFLQRQGLTNLLVAILVTCLLMGLIGPVQISLPRPEWGYLPLLTFLVCLESAITTRWLADPARRLLVKWHYRLAEFALIAFGLRLFTWGVGGWPTLAELQGYLVQPLNLLDTTLFIYLLVAFLGWLRVISLSLIFDGLLLSSDEISFYMLPVSQQMPENRPRDLDRPTLFANLVKSWLIGGFFLALSAAISTIDLTTFSIRQFRTVGRLGLSPQMLLALLVYFGLGLWLISQARLAMMQVRWLTLRVRLRPGLVTGWQRTSFGVLLAVALVAAFLPIGSTFAIANILNAILGFVFGLMHFLFVLFAVVLAFFLSILGFNPAGDEPSATPLPLVVTPAPELLPPLVVAHSPSVLAGTLFWLAVIIGLVVAAVFYLRERGFRLDWTIPGRVLAILWAWLESLWRGVSGRVVDFAVAMRNRFATNPTSPSNWSFVRFNRLSPRDQIRYFYLSVIGRAAQKGSGRLPHQTPAEYSGRLKEVWPESSDDIEQLTNAFQEARYSPRPIPSEEVNPLKEIWRRLRKALKRERSDVSE